MGNILFVRGHMLVNCWFWCIVVHCIFDAFTDIFRTVFHIVFHLDFHIYLLYWFLNCCYIVLRMLYIFCIAVCNILLICFILVFCDVLLFCSILLLAIYCFLLHSAVCYALLIRSILQVIIYCFLFRISVHDVLLLAPFYYFMLLHIGSCNIF